MQVIDCACGSSFLPSPPVCRNTGACSPAMPSAKSSSKRTSSQPPAKMPGQSPAWMQHQAERLDASRRVFSGLTDAKVSDLYPTLYTKSATEAVDMATKMVKEEGQSSQPAKSTHQPGQSSSSSQPNVEWVRQAQDADEDVRTHHEANLMQNRFGEDSPTMFNPARHTVVIAGRPVQATCDGLLVMSPQPCADNQSFKHFVAFLSFFPGALVASRVYFCPST